MTAAPLRGAGGGSGGRMLPPVLPRRIAFQVAWSSMRVRMTRNLITVSSVVLAVAFLLTVVGESICTQAVYRRFHDDSLIGDQAQQLIETLGHPRDAMAFLHLLATQDREVCSWAKRLGGDIPAVDAEHCLLCERLGRWVGTLKPAQIYLLTRNRDIDEWLLQCDSPGQIDHLRLESAGFAGVRLPLSHSELERVAQGMQATRHALAQLHQAESARLRQVDDAGGVQAVVDRFIDHGDTDSAGLPISQVLGQLDAAQTEALIHRLSIDRMRARVIQVLNTDNRRDPALLQVADIRDWAMLAQAMERQILEEGESPTRRLAQESADHELVTIATFDDVAGDPPLQAALLAAVNSALPSSHLFDEAAWETYPPGLEANELLKQGRSHLSERQVTRLNRLLLESAFAQAIVHRPAEGPYDLQLIADPGQLAAPANARIHDLLVGAVGGSALVELGEDLRRRASLSRRAQAFSDMGYDAQAGSGRLVCLVILSLLVCVVGIVNSMMMSVTERYREIATMKCLGATDGFIRRAFLIESSATGLVGAALGVGLGLVIVLLQASSWFGADFWAVFPLLGLAGAACGALACGIGLAVLGALLPARKAARMLPIEAMREAE